MTTGGGLRAPTYLDSATHTGVGLTQRFRVGTVAGKQVIVRDCADPRGGQQVWKATDIFRAPLDHYLESMGQGLAEATKQENLRHVCARQLAAPSGARPFGGLQCQHAWTNGESRIGLSLARIAGDARYS